MSHFKSRGLRLGLVMEVLISNSNATHRCPPSPKSLPRGVRRLRTVPTAAV